MIVPFIVGIVVGVLITMLGITLWVVLEDEDEENK